MSEQPFGPYGRALNAILNNYTKAVVADIERQMHTSVFGNAPRPIENRPWHGPAGDGRVLELGEYELGVHWDPEHDTYEFTCPGWESEPVYLSGEQVDALAERLLAHRQRRLYP